MAFTEFKVDGDCVIDAEGGIVYDDLSPRAAGIIAELLTHRSIFEAEREPHPAEWQPIESARQNGDRYLLWIGNEWCCIGYWDRDPADENGQCWRSDGDCERIEPTHWMKLPDPPRL